MVDIFIDGWLYRQVSISTGGSRHVAVFREVARVLRPGGRIGITDIVAEDSLTPEQRLERGSWVGCIAGALSFAEYEAGLRSAGLSDISVTPTHPVADGMHSAIIRASKPSPTAREAH